MKSLLEKVNAKLNAQGGFLKAVSVLVGGTAFAQLISFICLPILTRLYSPQSFASLAFFTSIVGLLSVSSCLRLELAIPLPDNDKDAISLVVLSFLINIIFCLLLVFLLIMGDFLDILDLMKNYVYILPVAVFLSGFYNILLFWHSRKKNYKQLAKSKLNQSILSNIAQLMLGILKFESLGLILGQIFNYSGGVYTLIKDFYKNTKLNITTISIDDLISVLKQYKKFPIFSTFEALAHAGAIHLPILLIAFYLDELIIAFVTLAMRVMMIPITLAGGAISQVYLVDAVKFHNERKMFKYSISILIKIIKIVVPIIVLMGVFSYYLIGYILGKEWEEVGYYSILIIPWLIAQVLASPFTMGLHIIGRQKDALYLQVFGFLIRVVGLILIGMFFKEILIYYFLLSGFVFYLLYLFYILKKIYLSDSEEKSVES